MAVNIPATTAIPHPVVMAIHPAFSPFDFFSRTLATTPSPSKISTNVPMNSPRNGPCILRGPPCGYDELPLKGHLILKPTVSLKRDPDTNQSASDAANQRTTPNPCESRLYGDSVQSNERVTAFFQK